MDANYPVRELKRRFPRRCSGDFSKQAFWCLFKLSFLKKDFDFLKGQSSVLYLQQMKKNIPQDHNLYDLVGAALAAVALFRDE